MVISLREQKNNTIDKQGIITYRDNNISGRYSIGKAIFTTASNKSCYYCRVKKRQTAKAAKKRLFYSF